MNATFIENINHKYDKVSENNEEYYAQTSKVYQEHDKIFRKILEDKNEAVKFLNKVLKLENDIKREEIEKYNTRFITSNLRNQESDIVYKLKNNNIFFLIEHQTKIDYSMPFRILQYEVDIIKSAIDINKIKKKDYKIPEVIPVVLYTGRKKWNANKYIKESQEMLEGYKGIEFAKYNLIDVNNFKNEELLKEPSFLSKAMLIEKTSQVEELPKILEKIIDEMNIKKEIYSEEQKELLIKIIKLLLSKRLGKEKIKQLVKKLKEKGETNMLAVLEMVEEENKMLIERGRKAEKVEIAKRMLKENTEIKFIEKITGLKIKEIKKIKNKYNI